MKNNNQSFNGHSEAARLRTWTKVTKKTRFFTSKLDKFRDQIVILRKHQATFLEIKRWLDEKNTHVDVSTVTRWFQKNG